MAPLAREARSVSLAPEYAVRRMTSPVSPFPGDHRHRVEREWLERVRVGDERAFEEVFRAYVDPLFNFALSYVESSDIADEIVQDLFCTLWAQRFTLDMPRGMRPYLFAAVRNRALNVLRDRRVQLAMHERLARRAGDLHAGLAARDSDATTITNDLAAAVSRVVRDMPPRCREVFTLLRYQHMTYAEVAHLLAISPKTVEIHMSRALNILREELAPWLNP
jgi:RNA polymerase sigma-70 factor (ECF subfamily)